ncbi:TM2 domain-containing protein 3 isoform X1 [Lepisosteus oculatus]|uniref:TM2 domain-containing protein 3 n=1 Tax=Lepisosteus oculatus TaxID=7918 RepID=W5NBF7_LEPOC|nr:PREDICTED: TM2 domain-containing protein 3 isoform X1 [Lepisosteus oculatus]
MATDYQLQGVGKERYNMNVRGIILLLLLDSCLQPVRGYLSSPHAGHDPSYGRDAQQTQVLSTSAPPAPASSGETPLGGSGQAVRGTDTPADVSSCPSGGLCTKLPAECITCKTHTNCTYGREATFQCTVKPGVHCTGGSRQQLTTFSLNMTCRFCWQLPASLYKCTNSTSCMTVACPRRRYNATCAVLDHVHCLGARTFPKRLYCNWTGGYRWSTALALSVTLGGFGADRFYLGQWREGLGKLFSFGGLGIWTLIDVLLIGLGYIGPADGSLYI